MQERRNPQAYEILQANNFRYEHYQAGKIDISAYADLLETGKIDININSTAIKINDYEISDIAVMANGSAENHIVDFSSSDNHQKINISAKGKLTDKR